MEDSSRKLGSKLSELRKARKMSQQEVAKLVSVGSDPISNRAVSKWETGDTLPNAEQFLALCRIYNIRDVLSTILGPRIIVRIDVKTAVDYVDTSDTPADEIGYFSFLDSSGTTGLYIAGSDYTE